MSRQLEGRATVPGAAGLGGHAGTARISPRRSPHGIAHGTQHTYHVFTTTGIAFHFHFIGTGGNQNLLNMITGSTTKLVNGHQLLLFEQAAEASHTALINKSTMANSLHHSPSLGSQVTYQCIELFISQILTKISFAHHAINRFFPATQVMLRPMDAIYPMARCTSILHNFSAIHRGLAPNDRAGHQKPP